MVLFDVETTADNMKANGAFGGTQAVCTVVNLGFQSKRKIRGLKTNENKILLLTISNET